jgi:hypothetical protein
MTDRIFVPLNTEAFDWFESGTKRWELRRVRGQYTLKHIRPGRLIEFRKGYRQGSSLWGTVLRTTLATGVADFFSKVPFSEVIPSAKSQVDAIAKAERILRVPPGALDEVIGIEVGEVSRNAPIQNVPPS